MKFKPLRALVAIAWVIAATAGGPTPAMAETPSLAPYPPPGGVTAPWSGVPRASGGRTITYQDFDPSAYSDLYYAVGGYPSNNFDPGRPGLSFNNSAADLLSFNAGLSNLSAGIAVFSGQTLLNTIYGSVPIYTRFQLVVTDTTNAALALIDPTTVSIPGVAGAVLKVTSDFKANWQFLASLNGTSYQSAQSLYDNYPYKPAGQQSLRSDIGGAFYYTSPVPEPEGYGLALAGMAVVGVVMRRRFRKT